MRILLVDQEKVVCYVLSRLLAKKTGAQVETASTLYDAFISLHKDNYDLVIMENRFPEASGLKAIKLILDKWPELHIIMYTTDAFGKDFDQEALAMGVKKVFWKPVELEGLVDYIIDILKL